MWVRLSSWLLHSRRVRMGTAPSSIQMTWTLLVKFKPHMYTLQPIKHPTWQLEIFSSRSTVYKICAFNIIYICIFNISCNGKIINELGPWSVPKPPGGIGWPWGSRQYWATPRGMEMTPSLRVQWSSRVSRKALGVSLPAIRDKPWATVFKRKKGIRITHLQTKYHGILGI